MTRQHRQSRFRAAADVLALLSLVAMGLAAAFVLPDQIDLTRKRAFTLAPQTQNLLAPLDQPVEITLLAPREAKSTGDRAFAQAAGMFRELLDVYRRHQPLLVARELDPVASAEARQLLQRFPDVIPPCVLIRWGDERKSGHEVLHARDIVEVQNAGPGKPPIVEFFGEQALTAALVRLTSGRRQTIIYTLAGHGELALDDDDPHSRRGLGVLASRWRELDIECRTLDLRMAPRVPVDADLVLIAGGEQPWSPSEVEALRRYLAHGGHGFVLVDLNCDASGVMESGLEGLLAEFGVALGNDRIVMRGFTGQVDASAPAWPAVADHPLTRSLSPAPVVLYECRSVRPLLGTTPSPLRSIPLLVSHAAPEAWAEADLNGDQSPEPGGPDDLPGPVAMAAAVERQQGDLHEPVLVVAGDSEFINNRSLSDPAGRSAASFALGCANWLRGRRDLLGDIPSRRHEGYRLEGNPSEQRGLVWKSALLLCAMILTAAGTVWVRRRDG